MHRPFNKPSISTHSRAKAAGNPDRCDTRPIKNFNSQPREGGWQYSLALIHKQANFNSQPREGGWKRLMMRTDCSCDFNSQPREGGWGYVLDMFPDFAEFQLTAARRRLEGNLN